MNSPHTHSRLNQIAREAVSDTYDLWPVVRGRLSANSSVDRSRLGWRVPRWRRLAIASLGSAALLALALAATVSDWHMAETVSAETLLDRAQTGVDVSTYHLLMTRQTPAKDNVSTASEVWFGGPDRQRSQQQTRDVNGAVVASSEVVFNGPQTWIAQTDRGQTKIIHTTGTLWTKVADDPTAMSSLTEVLSKYSQNKQCLSAKVNAESNVAGRAAYVIGMSPKPFGCGFDVAVGDYKPGQVRQGNSDGPDAAPKQMQVWIDKQTFLPLKTEVRDSSGALLDRSEVTSIQYGVALADSIFSYTPPAGAQVASFTGGDGADVKRALFSGPPPSSGKPGR